MPRLGKSSPEKFNMALDEQQKLLNAGKFILIVCNKLINHVLEVRSNNSNSLSNTQK